MGHIHHLQSFLFTTRYLDQSIDILKVKAAIFIGDMDVTAATSDVCIRVHIDIAIQGAKGVVIVTLFISSRTTCHTVHVVIVM